MPFSSRGGLTMRRTLISMLFKEFVQPTQRTTRTTRTTAKMRSFTSAGKRLDLPPSLQREGRMGTLKRHRHAPVESTAERRGHHRGALQQQSTLIEITCSGTRACKGLA
eukprot:95614-Prymnesium_polylepis.1